MRRFIEVYDDNKLSKQFTSDELPFEIHSQKKNSQSENDEKNQVFISIIEKNELEDKTIHAYISQDDGHLFLQPNTELTNNEISIFHNDERIDKSVWLKSGDRIQIGDKLINYSVSGDKINIEVEEKDNIRYKHEPTIITPPKQSENMIKNDHNFVTTASLFENNIKNTSNKKTKKILIISTSILLSLMAFFVLFAQTATIKTEPMADIINLSGLFPAIKINRRYILLTGHYDLHVYKKGYKEIKEELKIDSKNKEFNYQLEETPGLISFNISPEKNNNLYIDDALINSDVKSNKAEYEVTKGIHTIVVTNERYKKYEQIIKVEGKNKKQNFKIKLEQNWAYLKINSETEDVSLKIYSDNDFNEPIYNKELNDLKEIELITGEYTLKINKEKFKEQMLNVTIEAGKNINLNIKKLIAKEAEVKLSSEPKGSLISIDGQYMGRTPQLIKLTPNIEHKIKLSLSGYNDLNKTINLEPEVFSEQHLQLKSVKGMVFITVLPAQAQLFIDGKKQKESSGQFNLSGNNHTITVKAKGYKSQTKKINSSTYSKNLSFSLNKIKSKKINKENKKNSVINKKLNYKNSIDQKMILINPSTFMMGSTKNESGRGSNEREHRVKINYPYFLSEKEISNKQFRQYKNSHNSGNESGTSLNTDKQPVVNISWNEAAKFANWLSQKEGLERYYKEVNKIMVPIEYTSKKNGYRLPYEAEWSLAAKGKKHRKYPWTGNFPPTNMDGNFADESAKNYVANIIEGYDDKNSVSAITGSYSKNASGFYDMGGNVSEWCQDFYSPNFGLSGSALSGNGNSMTNNPMGPKKGIHKVVKDSSWRDASITELRLSYRSYSKKKAKDIGFRIARNVQ